MRIAALALILLPAAAQAQQVAPRAAPPPTATSAAPADTAPDQQAKPLAASRERILTKNESYNLARAEEGRVGTRLGNDMSYRVTGN